MKLADRVSSTLILQGGECVSKPDLLLQLLQHLASSGHVDARDVPSLHEAVLRREGLGSTAIGQGIAIPHTRHDSIRDTLVLFAVCRSPVHFDSIDAEPTDLFVLCLGPSDQSRNERQALRWSSLLMRHLTNKAFCEQLRQAQSPAELWDRLVSADDERNWM